MTQVMCVKQEWVHEAVMAGRLSEDPAEKFKAHIFSALDVIAVGPQIYRNIVYTQKDNIIQTIEANLPQQCIASPVMDRSTDSKEWGIVRFFTPQISHNAVEVIVKQCVREEQKKLQQQTREFGISTDHDSTRLVIGAGGSVKQVIMPYQFRTVVAVCSNEGDWVNVLKRYMNKYGEVENTQFKKCHNDFRLFVTYSTPVAAQRALSACQYPNVTLRPWHSQQFTLKIRWQRRQRGNFAFLSFDSAMHCRSAFPTVPCAIRHERYGQINVFQDKQNDECKLFLTGDILSIMNEDLIRTRIAEYIGDDIHFHLKMGYNKYDPCVASEYLEANAYPHFEEELGGGFLQLDDVYTNHLEYLKEEDEADTARRYHKALEEDLKKTISKYAEPGAFSLKFNEPTP